MSSSSKEGLLAVCGALTGLGIVSVGLRFSARRHHQLRLLADDWFILAAAATYTGASICGFLLVHHHSLGYPTSSTLTDKFASELNYAWDILNDTTLACNKISIVFFYRRVFGVARAAGWLRPFDIATRVSLVLIVLWWITFVLLSCLQCGTHFDAPWTGTFTRYCTISTTFLSALAISDFILDFWVLVLPLHCIFRFSRTTAEGLSILGLFLLAFIGLGASIAKMVVFIQVEIDGTSYFVNHNQAETLTRSFYLAMLESGISLLAANLPPLWLPLTHIPERAAQTLRSMRSLSFSPSGRSKNSSSRASSLGRDAAPALMYTSKEMQQPTRINEGLMTGHELERAAR